MIFELPTGLLIMIVMFLIGALIIGLLYLGEYAEKRKPQKNKEPLDNGDKVRKYITSMGSKKE